MTTLKDKVLEEMLSDHSNALERNFEIAKKLIRVTNKGKVDVLYKSKLTGPKQILLYLIGKLYAKEAGLCDVDFADNKELISELGIKEGSVLPWTKFLRDDNSIEAVTPGCHRIKPQIIESTLKEIEKEVMENAK